MGTDNGNALKTVSFFLVLIISETVLTIYLFFSSTHEVVEVDGFLYALGGNDGSSSLNSCEKYDPKTNKWTIVSSMVTRRSSVGSSVLDCFNLERSIVVQQTNL